MKELIVKAMAVLVLVLACGCAASGDPGLDDLPTIERGRHFDLASSGPGTREALDWADEAYEMFAELLDARPERVKLLVLQDQDSFDRAVGPQGQGTDGVYRALPSPLIVTMPHKTPSVIRHEVAHHFIAELLGDVPLWMSEGLAEILEGVRRSGGTVEAPIVNVWHLDRYGDGCCTSMLPGPGRTLHAHVDYSAAWALTAHLLSREQGALRARILALRRFTDAPPDSLMPEPEKLVQTARAWTSEIVACLDSSDESTRAAAARLLGKLGEASALRRASGKPQSFRVAAALAGSLARTGDRSFLRALVPQICCEHALHQVCLAVGREFRSVDDLKSWLAHE